MFIVETLEINEGDAIPADGTTLAYAELIPAEWCKIAYIKIVQLTPGPMEIDFDIVEDINFDPVDRTTFYLRKYRRTISMAEGGEYGEALSPPIPYKDREDKGEARRRFLYPRLTNRVGGTASDFAVSFTLADIGEDV